MSKSINKETIIQDVKRHDKDTGSPEVQIALLTGRINYLRDHFKMHSKDLHSRRGLISMTNKRRKLMRFLKKSNLERYERAFPPKVS